MAVLVSVKLSWLPGVLGGVRITMQQPTVDATKRDKMYYGHSHNCLSFVFRFKSCDVKVKKFRRNEASGIKLWGDKVDNKCGLYKPA